MKRKLIKIMLIIVSTLAVLLIILALAISPLAKNYIVKHSKELVGRKIQIHDLKLNIFTGTLEIDSVCLYEKNDKDVFASIDTFSMNLELTALIRKNLKIKQLKVINPYVDIIQNGHIFNFDDLMPKNDTTKTDTPKSSFPKSIVINNIYFHGGKLVYTDEQLKNTIRMNDLGVAIPELRFGEGDTKGGIHLKIGDNATFVSKLNLNNKTKQYELNLIANKLEINMFKPYVKENFNIGEMDGIVNANLLFSGDMNHIMGFKMTGSGDAKGLILTNSSGEPLISADLAQVKMNNISYSTSEYVFDFIHASNAKLDFIMNPDPKPNNFMAIFKPEKPSNANDTTHVTFKVNDLHVVNSQLNFEDKSMPTTYKLAIKKVDFQANNFDLTGYNDLKMTGFFQGGGFMKFGWKGNKSDFSNQKISINMRNFGLKLVSPYCKYYTAYDITSGNMNFVSKTNIRNNNLQSSNSIDVFKMNVGNKHKGLKVKYNVPLKLALYVMKDKDEKINFSLPVNGNTKDPKFNYTKIIWQTVVNLLVKVALSPVKFLAGTLGMNPDKMENIQLDALQSGFTAEQYSQINDLAEIVKKKPDLQLALTQYANLDEILPSFALYKAKYNYLNSLKSSDNKNPINGDEVQSLQNSDPDFVNYLDSLVLIKGKTTKNITLTNKAISIYVPDSLKIELMKKFDRRNAFLANYMETTLEIPKKNLNISTAVMDSLKIYTGKPVYKIGMTLPGTADAN